MIRTRCPRKVLIFLVGVVVGGGGYQLLLFYHHDNITTSFSPFGSSLSHRNKITTTTTTVAAATEGGGRVAWWREVVCTRGDNGTDQKGAPLKQLIRNVTPESNKSIFLMDTACNPNPKYRVWCSVESWARNCPDRQVWFLLTSDGLAQGELPSTLLKKYTNLQVVGADLNDLFKDTPLLPLFNSGKWTTEDTWPVELLSDMLRALVLWRWGGVYSDTDVISVRPFTLPLNAVGFENPNQLGSAFYTFTARHPLLLELMKDMSKKFNPKQWGTIGPKAMSRVVQKTCGKALSKLILKAPVTCPGNLTLYSTRTFYPIYYSNPNKFFKPGGGKRFDEMFNDTFTLHFWNKVTKGKVMKVNKNSIYEVAAKRFCPVTFQTATANSDVF